MVRSWSEDDPKAALMSRKRALIVDAALRAFLEAGYAESSVNRIAADAGVSIKTLYRHFESKDDLFTAVMDAACAPDEDGAAGAGKAPAEPAWLGKPPKAALPLAGVDYLRHALSRDGLALYRVVVRDAHRFPELGLRYREQVIGRRISLFVAYLDRWSASERWSVANKPGAAAVFAGLLGAGLLEDALLGGRVPGDAEIVRRGKDAAAKMLVLLEGGHL